MGIGSAVASPALAPPAPSAPPASSWPRLWSQRRALLERQHEQLGRQLAALIRSHSSVEPAIVSSATSTTAELGPSAAEPAASGASSEKACQQLLRGLSLHLRLEERWLGERGAMCPGHRVGHRDAARAIAADLRRAGSDRQARLLCLQATEQWFHDHCQGPDAMAYAAADRAPQL